MSIAEEKMPAALDRYREAHFFIHFLERYYHQSDPFRYSLNCFIRAIKEVPLLISNELQREAGFPAWIQEQRVGLRADPLISHLSQQRDFIVHRGMLQPESMCTVGITEGRGVKLGLGQPMDPMQDSDDAMQAYLLATIEGQDLLGLLKKDKDSEPCVEREWKLEGFDEEVVALCGRAWLRIGELINEVIRRLGEVPPGIALDCLAFPQLFQVKVYPRKALRKWRKKMKKELRRNLSDAPGADLTKTALRHNPGRKGVEVE